MTTGASSLVSRDWLAARAGDASLVLVDLRLAADGGRVAHEAAHVPGAVFSDYAGDGWRQRIGDVPGLLPTAAHLSALLARLGITPEKHVILIPAGSNANDFAASARACWTLKLVGHQAVSLLDGGTRGWVAAGLPVETGFREPVAAVAYPVKTGSVLRSEAGATLAAMEGGTHVLVDARSAGYFAGREKASEAKAAGHIPGAISADYVQFFDAATGALKPAAELERLFAAVPTGKPVISYCNTGHTAALNWFVLSEVLYRPDVTLYDGSMTDWTQDESRPVATGA